MGTVIVGLVLAGIVGFIIRSMIRDKKNGKSIHCGGDCKNCGGHCHQEKVASTEDVLAISERLIKQNKEAYEVLKK